VRSRRFFLALLYGLATLVAQGLHDHGGERRGEAAAVGLAGCEDPRPHFSGHGAPELKPVDLNCLACQFRGDHQAEASRVEVCSTPTRRLTILVAVPRPVPGALSQSTCRGPPLA
jgi:hypothetical protein